MEWNEYKYIVLAVRRIDQNKSNPSGVLAVVLSFQKHSTYISSTMNTNRYRICAYTQSSPIFCLYVVKPS